MAHTSDFVLTSLIIMVASSLLYVPLPESLQDPWTYRLHGLALDAVTTYSAFSSKIFGGEAAVTARNWISYVTGSDKSQYSELEVSDLDFDGVTVRLYKPKTLKDPAPCVIFIHGGGWILFDINSHDSVATNLALKTGMIVVSINYRLTPENPYPAPFDDCYKATKHLLQNGKKYGINVKRVAISGDSAGGNLATTVAMKLSQDPQAKTLPPLKLQIMIYPVTQVLNLRTSSYRLYKDYPILNQKAMAVYIASYLGLELKADVISALTENRHVRPEIRRKIYSKYFQEDRIPNFVIQNKEKDTIDPFDESVDEEIAKKVEKLVLDPYISPLLAEKSSLAKLPPAYMCLAEFDVLRDEGLLYLDRLKEAGVKVELSYAKGLPHASMAPFLPVMGFSNSEEWEKIYTYVKQNL